MRAECCFFEGALNYKQLIFCFVFKWFTLGREVMIMRKKERQNTVEKESESDCNASIL